MSTPRPADGEQLGVALRNQWQCLTALILAESQNRFARRSLGLFEEMGSIVIHVIGFSALRLAAGATTHYGMAEIPFLTSGVFVYWVIKSNLVAVSNFHTAKTRYAQFPRVTQLDILLARMIVNTTLYTGLALATFLILVLTDLSEPPRSLWRVIMVFGLSASWAFVAGLVLGGVYTYVPILRTLTSGILRVIMYTSGVFFVWPEVPYSLRDIVIYNPLFHMEEFMRSAYFQLYDSPVADAGYLAKWMLATAGLGLVTERLCRARNLRPPRYLEADQQNPYSGEF